MKRCVVSKEGGKEGSSKGAIYMMPVEEEEEDPEDPEDPFAQTCDEKLGDCQTALAKHKPVAIECMSLGIGQKGQTKLMHYHRPRRQQASHRSEGRKYVLECNLGKTAQEYNIKRKQG